jgi:hypothetical protein
MLYRHCSSTLLREYVIIKIQEKQVGLKSNGTHQLLVCVDDVNLLEGNIDTIRKNTETLIDASKEVGWTKWRWGRFSPSTSVSPANLHSTE